MTLKEDFTRIYLDAKDEFKKKTRNGIIILSIGIGLIIFSIFVPGKALIIPATAVCIVVSITLYRNSRTKKDEKIMIDETLKRTDNPDKYK
jgi:membrane-bound ClpP family serine protease